MSKVLNKIPVTLWEKYSSRLLSFIKPGFPQRSHLVASSIQVVRLTHQTRSPNMAQKV
jgi:hypothetical protein